jgi:hypothetical protein
VPDDQAQEAELNHFWNALTGHANGVDAAGLDARQAETVRRVHTMSRTFPPLAARARIDAEMRVLYKAPANGKASLDPRRMQIIVLGPERHPDAYPPAVIVAPPAFQPTGARFSWAAMPLATPLLVLLTLGLVFLMVAPARLNGEIVPGIRSVFAPETVISGVTFEQTLFSSALPVEALPHGDRISGNLSHVTVEPGTASSWEPAPNGCCPGVRVDYVVEGELVVRPGGPARVMRSRADLSSERVAAGTEVLLGPGDTLMSRYEDPFESENAGTIPVRLLDWVFVDGFVTSNHGNPSGWDYHFDGHSIFDLVLGEQAATLRLDRVTLRPGAVLPVAPGDTAQFGLTLADDEPLGAGTDGTLENDGDTPITVHVLTVTPVAPGGGTLEPLATGAALDTVFATTLATEIVPVAGNLDFLLWRAELHPGLSARHESRVRGPQITTVIDGELTVRADGPLHLFRAASDLARAAEVPNGTEVVLRPGDTAVYAFDRPVAYENRGSTPVQIVSGGLFAGFTGGLLAGSNSWLPGEFRILDYNQDFAIPTLPPGPVAATLVRATLPPDGDAPAPPPGSLVLEVGAIGDAAVVRDAEGSLRNIGEATNTIYILSLIPVNEAETAATS